MKRILLAAAALSLAPLAQAADISVSYSEDFAEELEENYGTREGEYLTREIIEDLEREFGKKGVDPARVEVTIINAKPNRPTIKQLGDEPGLDFGRSIAIGGMDLEAKVFDASGAEVSSFQYDWFENDIRFAQGASTWSDANRASRRFATKFAKSLGQ